jgi:hypothetical protein
MVVHSGAARIARNRIIRPQCRKMSASHAIAPLLECKQHQVDVRGPAWNSLRFVCRESRYFGRLLPDILPSC